MTFAIASYCTPLPKTLEKPFAKTTSERITAIIDVALVILALAAIIAGELISKGTIDLGPLNALSNPIVSYSLVGAIILIVLVDSFAAGRKANHYTESLHETVMQQGRQIAALTSA